MVAYYKSGIAKNYYLPLVRDIYQKKIPAVFVALQTTGLLPEGAEPDEIVQLSAVKCRVDENLDFVAQDSLSYVFKPKKKMPEEAKTRNGLTDEMLASAPDIAEKWDTIAGFFREPVVLVAHNINFVTRFFDALALNRGMCLPAYAKLDTSELAGSVLRPGMVKSYTYRNLFSFFGISVGEHDNYGIARGLVDLANILLQRFRTKPPECGTYIPEIEKLEYLGSKIAAYTRFGKILYDVRNRFWEDPEGGLLMRFFDMDRLELLAFQKAGASDRTEFRDRMQHLVTC